MRYSVGIITLSIMLCGAVTSRAEGPLSKNTLQLELAKRHYRLGETYYMTGDYQQAVKEFEKAYAKEPAAGLQYNIGRCYELLGELKKALVAYETFLKEGKETERADRVRLVVGNLRKRIKQQKTQPEEAQTEETRTNMSALQSVTQPSYKWQKITGWSLVGAGAASMVLGIIYGVKAKSKADEYNEQVAKDATYQKLSSIQDSGELSNTISMVGLIAGGVLAAGGGALLWWGYSSKQETKATVAPMVGRGLGLVAEGRF